MKTDMITVSSQSGDFPAYVVSPDQKPKGGLIVIHEVWGLAEHIKDVARRYAQEGYLVIAPDLLSETGITETLIGDLQEQLFDPKRRSQAQPKIRKLMAPIQAPGFGEKTLQKVQDCFEYLTTQLMDQAMIGITGFCFGGTYSFSLAVHEPRLKAAIPFYGHADFTIDQLKLINCPVLAFYGERDENLMASLPALQQSMSQAGVNFTAKVYKDCGHAFFNDTNPFAYNKAAAENAWQKSLAFLEDNL